MFKKIRIAIIVICLGISAGLGAHYLLNKEDGKLVTKNLRFEMPEGGVKTDAFSLRVFQESIKLAPDGSCIISPALVSEALLELESLAHEPLKQEIARQNLYTGIVSHTAVPPLTIVPAVDFSLKFQESSEQSSLMRLPFSSNFPLALELFNSTLVHSSDLPQQNLAHGKNITKRSRFVLGLACGYHIRLQTPFLTAYSVPDSFENDNGSIPTVNMLKTRGNFRYVRDAAGQWEAVALPLQPDDYGMDVPTVLIAIRPIGTADKWVQSLTVEELNRIRQSLLEAVPGDCSVSLPQMVYSPPLRKLDTLLSHLGLGKLFDNSAKNWNFADQNLGIDAMVERIHVSFLPIDGDADKYPKPGNAATVVEFNRPFIWMIGDLSTAAPFYFMGMVQNL